MTLLDFLDQHIWVVYWGFIFSFVYGVLSKLTILSLRDKQKFPDPGKDNTYITNNYWPGGPQEFVTEEAEEGVSVPTATEESASPTKDLL